MRSGVPTQLDAIRHSAVREPPLHSAENLKSCLQSTGSVTGRRGRRSALPPKITPE